MKKSITVIAIIVILLNLISIKSFAGDGDDLDNAADQLGFGEDAGVEIDLDDINHQKGSITTSDGQQKKFPAVSTGSTGSFVFSAVVKALTAIPQAANQLMEFCVETAGGESLKHFTIYDTVMGNYELFNLSYHDVPEEKPTDGPAHEVYKYYIIKFYRILRNLSMAISLFVLLYIAIRMAISTVASDKAKYSKMLLSWVSSLILLIFMHYIIIIISWLSTYLLGLVRDVAESFSISSESYVTAANFEDKLYSDGLQSYDSAGGWNVFTAALLIWFLSYYQVKFFLMYMKRIIEMGFLIIISPLVTITYSIDKIGDNAAQAFRALFTELIMKASIQLVHAVLYCVFIGSAGYIAQANPVLAALFFAALSRSEKVLRNIFNVKDASFEETRVPIIG